MSALSTVAALPPVAMAGKTAQATVAQRAILINFGFFWFVGLASRNIAQLLCNPAPCLQHLRITS